VESKLSMTFNESIPTKLLYRLPKCNWGLHLRLGTHRNQNFPELVTSIRPEPEFF